MIPGIQLPLRFDGPHEPMDVPRLAAQTQRVYDLMRDGRWRTLGEIENATGDPQASVSARLRDFRKPSRGSHVVERRRRGEPARGLFEYRVRI
jgi:hypothetical protein